MADRKGPTATAAPPGNKLAMSKALGAAFLNHQVEQLEKTVNGPGSGNWRARQQVHGNMNPGGGRGGAGRRNPQPPLQKPIPTNGIESPEKRVQGDKTARRPIGKEDGLEKDADVVVVDASVLVHALYMVKKWCKDGREEIIVIPLEALNTLDLLKKGTTPLAQRARAASRILEAQVGANPRILVQRDDAFVLWDKISFSSGAPTSGDEKEPIKGPAVQNASPEWVRRTICCARWEVENKGSSADSPPASVAIDQKPKVVLATLSSSPQVSPTMPTVKLPDPVPLPIHKHEPRSSGALVHHWATRANIPILPVAPTTAQPGGGNVSDSFDEPRAAAKRNTLPRRRNPSQTAPRGGGLVERPPAVMAMMELAAQPSKVVRVLARGEKLEPDP